MIGLPKRRPSIHVASGEQEDETDEQASETDEEDANEYLDSEKTNLDSVSHLKQSTTFQSTDYAADTLIKLLKHYRVLVIIILVVVISVISGQFVPEHYFKDIKYFYTRSKNIPINEVTENVRDDKLDSGLFELEKKYSKQEEDTWINLAAGIKSVIRENPNQPSTFLMVYDSDKGRMTAECLAREVSKVASEYLLHYSNDPHFVNGEHFNSKRFVDDPGQLLVNVKDPVEESGALVVTDLHKITPEVARMFHSVCDRYSPLVERAVTFFTLKVDSLPSRREKKKVISQRMKDLWSAKLADTFVDPLITRMTSHILSIYPDSTC